MCNDATEQPFSTVINIFNCKSVFHAGFLNYIRFNFHADLQNGTICTKNDFKTSATSYANVHLNICA